MLSARDKRKKLEDLVDEVRDLHPFVEALLRRLPGVQDVRNTHGTQEFGADFLLTKIDPTTERTRHVGVVVKSGSINQGDSHDLDRQIEECQTVPRTIEHGMKDIRIGEVWVICNQTISNNAKTIIGSKFRGLSIEFFDAADVVERTDKYAPFLWQNVPSLLSQYLVALDERLANEEQQAHLIGPVASVPTIDLEFAEIEIGEYQERRKRKRRIVRILEEIDSRLAVVVEGEMGAGKSHLLRRLARQYASLDAFESRHYVPVHTTYRRLASEYGGSIDACIRDALAAANSDLKGLEHTVLLLIDAIDEVEAAGTDGGSVIEDLIEQVRDRGHTRAVLSTRPDVTSPTRGKTLPDTCRVEIRPLTLGKIVQFVREVCATSKLPARLVDDVNHSDLFRQLPQNPIAAQLLTRLLLERRDELPQSLTELYKKSMELMLGRWDEQKGLLTQQEYDVARRVCGEIADILLNHRLAYVSIDQVRTSVVEYVSERHLVVDVARVEERILERSGILIKDEAAGKAYFRHRSFAEFLYADHWLGHDELGPKANPFSPYWVNPYFFWIGLKGDCEDVLKQVLAAPCANVDEQLGRVFVTPQYLMAGYLTRYAVTRDAVSRLLIEAAEIFHRTLRGDGIPALMELSPMQLLWLLAVIVRRQYGYRFFRPALDDAVTDILGSLAEKDVKATALFLASVTVNDLGDETPFRLLLEEFKPSELPITVSLAIEAESRNFDKTRMTAALKSFGKKLRQMAKVDKSGRNSFDSVYKVSISVASRRRLKRA